jgi:DNA-binding MarR family transcriptional regulator
MSTNIAATTTSELHTLAARPQLEREIGQCVPTAFILLDALDRRTLAANDPPLTTAQYHALSGLAQVPQQSLSELAGRLLCDKANASKIIDRLETQGLASRTPDPRDARRVVLSLTAAGSTALESANNLRAEALRRAFAPMQDESVSQIGRSLITLVARLRTALDHGASGRRATTTIAAE